MMERGYRLLITRRVVYCLPISQKKTKYLFRYLYLVVICSVTTTSPFEDVFKVGSIEGPTHCKRVKCYILSIWILFINLQHFIINQCMINKKIDGRTRTVSCFF